MNRSTAVMFAAVASWSAVAMAHPMTYTGTCDASAAVALGDDAFLVADDETDVLHVYSRSRPGAPTQESDVLASFLTLNDGTKEADIEGAAWFGKRVYWIASH